MKSALIVYRIGFLAENSEKIPALWNPFQCLQKMKRFATVRPNDYIMIKIEKYLKMNLDQGRAVMITFLPRDEDYGNRQADALGEYKIHSINVK